MSKLRPLLILGTRPEAIKMAPVVAACRDRAGEVEATVLIAGQHREMLAPVIDYFGIPSGLWLDLMTPDQSLAQLTARSIQGIDEAILRHGPHCVVAQGDTTTVMAASLAAFYRHAPLVHVEAGLRTDNMQSPWPEEMNRRVTDLVASLHCTTQRAADALAAEGVPPDRVHVTGNTVVDALLETVRRERAEDRRWRRKHSLLDDDPMVLITGHRRESFGSALENICRAIGTLAERFPDHQFVYPVHLNPNVWEPVHRLLADPVNVHLVDPAPYPEFVWLMDRSTLILTDSGGVQEEAPSLRKPVLVMRDHTERVEAVEAGAARLVGTSAEAIVNAATTLLTDPAEYAACQIDDNPYGDGRAAERIVELMLGQGWQ